MRYLLLFLLLLSGLLSACSSGRRPLFGRSAGGTLYAPDLADYRPRYQAERPALFVEERPAPPPAPANTTEALHVTERLHLTLDTLTRRGRSVKYLQGYKIQVYVGRKREEANAAKVFVYQKFPKLNPYLTYRQPTYQLRVGDFAFRPEAERHLAVIQSQYPGAMIVQDNVEIIRSELFK
jgi:hypothetical protein